MTTRERLHEIIFEADTPAGKAFDIALVLSVVMSVVVVMLDSVAGIRHHHGTALTSLEWGFTVLFTVEYILRIFSVKRPAGYLFSFFGVIDLLAILPTWISLLLPGGHYLVTIRFLRILRIFRVLKLSGYVQEFNNLVGVLKASRKRILVFILTVLTIVTILGSFMYLIEGSANGFSSIPRSVYWAIVTLTTVGYGDISPQTPAGQLLAAVIMMLGYSLIIVPAGLVSAEISTMAKKELSTQVCPFCNHEGHDPDARYCKRCGKLLNG